MSTIDETLAFNVADATMQDWLAAVSDIRFAPPSTYSTARFDPHPERPHPLPVRRPPTGPARRTAHAAPAAVAGARTAYWMGLALALAVLTFL